MQFFVDIILFLIYSGIVLLFFVWVYRFWMMYVNQKFLNKFGNDSVMLEIKLPREINKSPAAMETIMYSFLQGGGVGNKYSRNWQGNLPAYFSLEIASLEGVIHFYIRTHKKFKELIISNLYAQYPGIEVVDAEDYTKLIHYHHLSKDVELWGTNFKLGKTWIPKNPETGEAYRIKKPGKDEEDLKMRADFLPIKTYVDYGLDKDPKEEYKNDPIVPLLEFMGSVGKGEYVWYQILVQDEGPFDGVKFPKTFVNEKTHEHMTMAMMAGERKKQIRTRFVKKGTVVEDDYGETKKKKIETGKDSEGRPIMGEIDQVYLKNFTGSKKDQDLTVEEKDEIEMINKKLSKPSARAIIRLVYIAKKENFEVSKFNFGNHANSVLSMIRPFNGTGPIMNSFSPSPFDPYEYPWQNFKGQRTPWRKEERFEEYVEREGFYPHVGSRDGLDRLEDSFFWPYPMKHRKVWRMIFEAIRYPFDHPHADEICVLNTEELATLYHFPGQVASVPTLPRIDSAKSVAPTNLPM